MSATREATRKTPQSADLIAAPIGLFRHGYAACDELYLSVAGQDAARRVTLDTTSDLATALGDIEQGGHRRVLLRRHDHERVLLGLGDSLDAVAGDTRLPSADRFAVIQQCLVQNEGDRLDRAPTTAFVGIAQRVGRLVAAAFDAGGGSVTDVFAAAMHEAPTAVHATNTAAYSLLLAHALGDSPPLEEVAIGAALHPLGGRVGEGAGADDPAAPQRGFEALFGRDDVTFAQRMMVYQHREWVNGEGYPVRLPRDEIHAMAKVLAVVDHFDTLTCDQPRSPAVRPNEAVARIGKLANKQFDPEVVRCWMSLFDRQ